MTEPSAWKVKFVVYNFLDMLVKLKLSTYDAGQPQVEKFIRRHKSRYDTSPIIHSAYNDSLI